MPGGLEQHVWLFFLCFVIAPFVVGYVLGPMAELTIRQSLILANSNPAVLLDHPIAILFLLLAVLSIWRFAIAGARSMQMEKTPSVRDRTTQPETEENI